MNKASVVYVSMVLVLIVGLWVILQVGSHIRAVPEMNGEWIIMWVGPASAANLPNHMTIDQSGSFADVYFNDHHLKGRLTRDSFLFADHAPATLTAASSDGHDKLTVDPFNGGNELSGRFDRSFVEPGCQWTAVRASAKPPAPSTHPSHAQP